MASDKDRRFHPRANTSIQVRSRLLEAAELPMLASASGRPDPPIPQLQLVKSGAGVTRLASVNLSLGGLLASGDLEMDSDEAYADGADVVVELDLKDGQNPLRAVAQVKWCRSEGRKVRMGLMFLLITDSAYMRIQDYVQSHAENPSAPPAPPSSTPPRQAP